MSARPHVYADDCTHAYTNVCTHTDLCFLIRIATIDATAARTTTAPIAAGSAMGGAEPPLDDACSASRVSYYSM